MEENQKEVTKSTILKHYLSSLLVYGIVLLFISFFLEKMWVITDLIT